MELNVYTGERLFTPREVDLAVWRAARSCHARMASLRARRERLKKFAYGNQWCDPVRLPDGRVLTEREYAEQSGSSPATNNLLRQLVKSVVGRFRERVAQGEGAPSALPQPVARNNIVDELDARALEEFLISGCAVQRVTGSAPASARIDNVSPARLFTNDFRDPLARDLELIGMLHDMPFAEVTARFGDSSQPRYEALARLFGADATRQALGLAPTLPAEADWDGAPGSGRCRVAEVWTLESRTELRCRDLEHGTSFRAAGARAADNIGRENSRRRATGRKPIAWRRVPSLKWHCRWFGPEGALLWEHDSPWAHGSHPFALKLYPLIDGEVHPFLEDMVDQQKHINRLITLIDHIVGASAKGVLLFPRQAMVDGRSATDIADDWARPGAVLVYNAMAGPKPEILTTPRNDGAAASLLALEMKMIEQVSGVGAVLNGEAARRDSAALYQEQVRNATTALRDIFDTFDSFRQARDRLACGLKCHR